MKKRKMSFWSILVNLLRFAEKDKIPLLLGVFLFILANCSTLISAYTLSLLVENGLRPKNFEATIRFASIVCILESAYLFLFYFGKKFLASSGLRTLFRIREALFHKLSKLPMKFFDRTPMGRIHVRIIHDVDNIETFFSGSLPRIVNAVLSMTLVCISMILTNWKLGGLMLASIIPACVVTVLFSNPLRRWNHEYLRRNARVNSRLAEFLSGIPVVRSLGLEKWSHEYFRNEVKNFLQAALKVNIINSKARPLISLLSMMPLLTLAFWGSQQVLIGALSLGLFVTFIRYSERFYRPLMVISQEIHQVQTALTNMERVQELLDEDEELVSSKIKYPVKHGSIEIENLSMKYDDNGPWILKNLNLNVAAGEKVGILGRTGSGKTSLVSLLARLYPYQSGEILIDGNPIENYDLNVLRESVGFVTQGIQLFRGTVRENIAMGAQIGNKELQEICKETGFQRVLDRHSLKLDSALPWNGELLSFGERQWLSLCRIYTRDPKIIVLDEPTASLDPDSESYFFESFLKFSKNRTCLCIAHRIHTLNFCTRFLQIDQGKSQWIERPSNIHLS